MNPPGISNGAPVVGRQNEERDFKNDAVVVDEILFFLDSYKNNELDSLKEIILELRTFVAAELEITVAQVTGKEMMEVYQKKVEEARAAKNNNKTFNQDGFVILCDRIKKEYSRLNEDSVYMNLGEEKLQVFVAEDLNYLAYHIFFSYEFGL